MLSKGKIKKINEEIAKFNADQSLPENRIPVDIEEKIRKFGIELDKYCVDLEDEILGEIKFGVKPNEKKALSFIRKKIYA